MNNVHTNMCDITWNSEFSIIYIYKSNTAFRSIGYLLSERFEIFFVSGFHFHL